jgi:hypothetical protein
VGFSTSSRLAYGGDVTRQPGYEATQEVCSIEGGISACSFLSMFTNALGSHVSIRSRKNIRDEETRLYVLKIF